MRRYSAACVFVTLAHLVMCLKQLTTFNAQIQLCVLVAAGPDKLDLSLMMREKC